MAPPITPPKPSMRKPKFPSKAICGPPTTVPALIDAPTTETETSQPGMLRPARKYSPKSVLRRENPIPIEVIVVRNTATMVQSRGLIVPEDELDQSSCMAPDG